MVSGLRSRKKDTDLGTSLDLERSLITCLIHVFEFSFSQVGKLLRYYSLAPHNGIGETSVTD